MQLNKTENCTKTNILVCGLLWSGSSAVTDLLKEYENIGFVPGEFNDFRYKGAIGDIILSNNKDGYSPNSDFKKILNIHSIEYSNNLKKIIKSILVISPIGKVIFPEDHKQNKLNKYRLKLFHKLTEKIYSLSTTKKKLDCAQKWIQEIGSLYGNSSDFILYDQPIQLGRHTDIWPKVFNPFKMIIVYRNPYDQIAQIIKEGHLEKRFNSSHANDYPNTRSGSIEFNIDKLINKQELIQNIQEQQGLSKVMLISFERLVLDYQRVKHSIEEFLEINSRNHTQNKHFFDPEVSKKNIGLYKEYLFSDEIDKMEKLIINYEEMESNNPFYKI